MRSDSIANLWLAAYNLTDMDNDPAHRFSCIGDADFPIFRFVLVRYLPGITYLPARLNVKAGTRQDNLNGFTGLSIGNGLTFG